MNILLPNMNILDKVERASMSSFCSFINENKDSLTDEQKELVADYIISSVACQKVSYLNKGIYNFLRNYLMVNIGNINFSLCGDYVKEISLGNIKAGPLFSSNFTNEELSERYSSKKNSCGVLPTKNNMRKLFIGYGDKTIFSDDIGHSDKDIRNVHIGEYYFNVDDILKDKSNPYIFRFTNLYKDELQIDVLSFDKDGNFINRDIYVDYLESLDGINYKVARQIHNELEDINNLGSLGNLGKLK